MYQQKAGSVVKGQKYWFALSNKTHWFCKEEGEDGRQFIGKQAGRDFFKVGLQMTDASLNMNTFEGLGSVTSTWSLEPMSLWARPSCYQVAWLSEVAAVAVATSASSSYTLFTITCNTVQSVKTIRNTHHGVGSILSRFERQGLFVSIQLGS